MYLYISISSCVSIEIYLLSSPFISFRFIRIPLSLSLASFIQSSIVLFDSFAFGNILYLLFSLSIQLIYIGPPPPPGGRPGPGPPSSGRPPPGICFPNIFNIYLYIYNIIIIRSFSSVLIMILIDCCFLFFSSMISIGPPPGGRPGPPGPPPPPMGGGSSRPPPGISISKSKI